MSVGVGIAFILVTIILCALRLYVSVKDNSWSDWL